MKKVIEISEITRPMSIPFTHLHTHSPEGSLLDGFMRIDEAVKVAKSWGMDSLGISDHGTMAAYPKFNDICKKNGIKPVFGMEAYITPDRTFRKEEFDQVEFDEDENGNHVFQLMTPEELSVSNDFTDVETIKPRKTGTALKTEAKEFIESECIRAIQLEHPEIDVENMKVTPKRRFIKSQRDDLMARKKLCVRGDATRRNFFRWFPKIGHLLLIAKNDIGYHNLLRLQNIGQMEGFYRKPRIDYKAIEQYGEGIICSTACLASVPSQLILQDKYTEAKQEIQRYVDAFDEVYLEVQPSQQEDQWKVNNTLIKWSKEMTLPLLATSDVHMVYHEDLPMHEQLMNINRGKAKEEDDESNISVYDSAYFMHPDDMLANGIPPEAIENAHKIAMSTNVTALDDTSWKYPQYDIPGEMSDSDYLRALAEQGLFQRYMEDQIGQIEWEKYVERLNYELDIINFKKISSYFIIVWDFLNECHRRDILTGPGRGSAAGSLVAYCLRITNIDPIRWDLLFERFINPERPGFPDIDSDVDGNKRDEIIGYLKEKYGANKVAQIGTYITMKAKSALKDIGRVQGVDHNEINEVTKLMPDTMTLEEAIFEIPEVAALQEEYPKLFEEALDVEKLPKTASIHACGIEISPVDIFSNLPLMRGKGGETVIEYEGPQLEMQG